MLDARAALLASGTYAPIAEAVASAAREAVDAATEAHATRDAEGGVSVADLGCGTGYYAAAVARRLRARRLLAADRSPDAVRMTLRALGDAVDTTGVVLDLWRPLPLRDASADVVLDVFAPRNPPEYARVLAPGGALIVVVPSTAHLAGLREQAGMLDIPGGKDALVAEQFAAVGLQLAASTRVEYAIEADASRRALIAGMGPSAHHHRASSADDSSADDTFAADGGRGAVNRAAERATPVTVSVDVLTLRTP